MTAQPHEADLHSLPPQDYAFIAQNGSELVSLHDPDGKFSYASPALERYLQYPAGTLKGIAFTDLYNTIEYPSLAKALTAPGQNPVTTFTNVKIKRQDGKFQWASLNIKYLPDTNESTATNATDKSATPHLSGRFAVFYENIDRSKRIESMIGSLAFDPRVVPDEKFFEGLIWNTAWTLDMEFAFLTTSKPPYNSVRMLAFWQGDHFAKPYEYALDDTPCDRVIRHGETCNVPVGVQRVYPKDQDLVALNAQSYLGVPIYGHDGNIKGHLALLSRQPLVINDWIRSITVLFARQVSTILEKLTDTPSPASAS